MSKVDPTIKESSENKNDLVPANSGEAVDRRAFVAGAAAIVPVAIVACKTGTMGQAGLESTDSLVQATTLALGEESSDSRKPRVTTYGPAGEESASATTEAVGEEGGAQVTTFGPSGEEGGGGSPAFSTEALGEESGHRPGDPSTEAVGEEGGGGSPAFSTEALGEESGHRLGAPSTEAVGEEGGGGSPAFSTEALGEESGGRPGAPSTEAVGEEGGGRNDHPRITTFGPAGEESGSASTEAVGEEGGDSSDPDDVRLSTFGPANEEAGSDERQRITTYGPAGEESGNGKFTTEAVNEEGGDGNFLTTMAVGEEAGDRYLKTPHVKAWTAISKAFTATNAKWSKKSSQGGCQASVQLISVNLSRFNNRSVMKFQVIYLIGTSKGLKQDSFDIEHPSDGNMRDLQKKVKDILENKYRSACR